MAKKTKKKTSRRSRIKRFARKHAPKSLLAVGVGVGGLLALLRPTANGDGVANRLQYVSKSNPLGSDSGGNNILSIASSQIEENAISALLMGLGAAAIGYVGAKTGARRYTMVNNKWSVV